MKTLSWSRAALYGVMTVFCSLIALPFLWMVFSALKTQAEIFTSPFSPPGNPQWGNFTLAWNAGVGRYILNSFVVTSISVLLIVAVSAMAAYALARLEFKGRIAFYLLLITGYAIPIHTVIVPLYEMLKTANLINNYLALVGPYIAFGVPFSVFLIYAHFLEFPRELEEAARLDGASDIQIAWRIVMPLSLPALSSVAIFQGTFIWNDFLLALILINDDKLKTLPLGLLVFRGEYSTEWPLLMAGITVATLPLLGLYMIFRRQFVSSLTGFSK